MPATDAEIRIRVFSLDVPGDALVGLHGLLSDDEHARFARFRFARDRRRSIVARAGLRLMLAGETGVPPESLVFSYGREGKPALPRGPSFNLSHAGELAAVAITRDAPVGVDIEPLDQRIEIGDLSPILTAAEADFLRRDPSLRGEALLAYWVRKEAVGKAIGKGFSIPPIDLRPTLGVEQIVLCPGEGETAKPWTVKPFSPAAGYVGAVAAPGWERRVVVGTFDPLAQGS